MKDLADFLLARIAEKEEVARRAQEQSDGDLWVVTGSDNAVGVDYHPDLILAECKAEREIIRAALHGFLVEQIAPGSGIEGYTVALREVLEIFAAVHRNHPDYPEELQP